MKLLAYSPCNNATPLTQSFYCLNLETYTGIFANEIRLFAFIRMTVDYPIIVSEKYWNNVCLIIFTNAQMTIHLPTEDLLLLYM